MILQAGGFSWLTPDKPLEMKARQARGEHLHLQHESRLCLWREHFRERHVDCGEIAAGNSIIVEKLWGMGGSHAVRSLRDASQLTKTQGAGGRLRYFLGGVLHRYYLLFICI